MVVLNALFLLMSCSGNVSSPHKKITDSNTLMSSFSAWLLIDDFESEDSLQGWVSKDTRNDTVPYTENPQVTQRRKEITSQGKINHYLIKKPAIEGVVGNRKALTFKELPKHVPFGETYTFYTRFQVEYFPNNHVFGVSNLNALGIEENDYNAFEPTLRITDKTESNGLKNDGTLMVKKGKGYSKIKNALGNDNALPLSVGIWYQVWYVVNNASYDSGGQSYNVYVLGGEFKEKTMVYENADFRMKRESPLMYFLMNCNTGPVDKPYGNGGIFYDDIYMSAGNNLSSPLL